MNNNFSYEDQKATVLKNGNIPSHVAVIMDGNGRWAKKRGFERIFGHDKGVKSARETIEVSSDIGVKYLTLYTFSKENWNRPKYEVNALMSLLVKTIGKEISSLMEKNIKLKLIGKLSDLPDKAAKTMSSAMETTKNNTGMTLFIALSYSGRDEILTVVNKLIAEGVKKEITEKDIEKHLYTEQAPDPELLIRTGGEFRISNFLLWQIAYTEFYFLDVFWPDFTKKDFLEAIEFYQTRERRFGKITEQLK